MKENTIQLLDGLEKSKDFKTLVSSERNRYNEMVEELRTTASGGYNYKRFNGEELKDLEVGEFAGVQIHSIRLSARDKHPRRLTYYVTEVGDNTTIVLAGVGNHKFNGRSYLKKKYHSESNKVDDAEFFRLTGMDPKEWSVLV